MRLRVCALVALALIAAHGRPASAQSASFTGSYTQNFDGGSPNNLAATGTTGTSLPTGWAFVESGGGSNSSYSLSNGTPNSGDTYSFGATDNTERSFGTIRSNAGGFSSVIGVQLQNNSGSALAGFTVSYTGEQWYRGNSSDLDRLDFQYSLNATSVGDAAATWTNVNALDFNEAVTSGTNDPLNGNLAANQRSVSGLFTLVDPDTGLPTTLANTSNIWLRWVDFDSNGQDAGLAIDNLTVSPVPEPGTILAVAAGVLGLGRVARRRFRTEA